MHLGEEGRHQSWLWLVSAIPQFATQTHKLSSDPLYWQFLTRHPDLCHHVTFVDVDYRDLMLKKRAVIQRHEALESVLQQLQYDEGDVLLRSSQYVQLGCDLRDSSKFEHLLRNIFDLENTPVLLVAEVSITYMPVDAADKVIAWAAKHLHAEFCLLEQLLPDGESHPFAKTMLAHFRKLSTPLHAVHVYPTVSAQSARFATLGYEHVSACNLWQYWSSTENFSQDDRAALDSVEPFDEWEEFALFGCHYVLVVAKTSSMVNFGPVAPRIYPCLDINDDEPRPQSEQAGIYCAPGSSVKANTRFGSAIRIRGSRSAHDLVGNFGGMSLNSRTNEAKIHCEYGSDDRPFHAAWQGSGPSSRMCHTATDLGDIGTFLVGGRTSPDRALRDCWMYHKWLGIWEHVNELPEPRYRHFAVHLGHGNVLVGGGKLNAKDIAESFIVWDRRQGWRKCVFDGSCRPPAVFGANCFLLSSSTSKIQHVSEGRLIGGMTKGGTIQEASWKWRLLLNDTEVSVAVMTCVLHY